MDTRPVVRRPEQVQAPHCSARGDLALGLFVLSLVVASPVFPSSEKETKIKHITVILAWLLLLGIAGCAQTPQPGVEDGAHFNFRTARTPYSATFCIARNAKSRSGNITPEERLLGETSMEVIVRSRGETLAVAQVHRDGLFSTVSIRVTTSIRSDREGFARQLMADC